MSFTFSMESPSNMVRTLEYVNRKKSGTAVYVQGLISIGIFVISLLVVIFVYIPLISQTNETATKKKAVETEVAALQKKYNTISNYNKSELDDNLKAASVLIPDSIRVAQLATFINTNAKSHNLTVSRLGINEDRSEVKQSLGEEEKGKLLGQASSSVFLGRVEGPFGFQGTRDNIYKFLDFLVMGGFATNFDQVSITSGGKDNEWTVTFFTSYYYLEPVTGVPAAAPLLEVQKEALTPILVVSGTPVPTPIDTTTPSITPSVSQE